MKSRHSSHFPLISDFFIPTLPQEIISDIFDHLDFASLEVCASVNSDWNKMSVEKKNKILSSVFSPKDWNVHFKSHLISKGEMREAFNSLPANIATIPCPIYEGKKLIDTHVFTYIPKDLTINKCEEIFGYAYIWDQVVKQFGDISAKSGWRAMTKEALPGSVDKTFFIQKAQVDRLNSTSVEVFKIPTVLEGIVCISTEFFKTGKKIYQKCDTRCQENIQKYQVTVRDSRDGLLINHYSIHRSIGIAALHHYS